MTTCRLPQPPPVFVAVKDCDPCDETFSNLPFDEKPLTIFRGERYGIVHGRGDPSETYETWMRVTLLGYYHDKKVGWVQRQNLVPYEEIKLLKTKPTCLDDEMQSLTLGNAGTLEKTFDPFLGSWTDCYEKLASLAGIWVDDKGRKAKTYVVSVFPEGYANILTIVPSGDEKQGKKLVKVKALKTSKDVFGIFWSENFILNHEAGVKGLQWLPCCQKTHGVWNWTRK